MTGKTNRREFVTAAGLAATSVLATAPLEAAAPAPQTASAPRTMGAKLRELLKRGAPFENVAAPDVASARTAELLGFPSLYLGSSAMAEFNGIPDWGIASMDEQIRYFGHIAQNVDIPGIADIDHSGDALAFYRDVKALERAGIGGIHFGDGAAAMGQTRSLLPMNKMIDRIHAAADARTDMCISIRVQARNLESMEKAIERAAAYAEAGADTVWFVPMAMNEIPQAAAAIKVPVTAQMFVDTTVAAARESKVTVMVYATFLQNIMQNAMYEALTELKSTGLMTKAARGQRLGQGMPADVRAKVFRSTDLTDRGKKYNV
jgi:methylisocitrate lyase